MKVEQKRILIHKIINLPTLPTVLSKIVSLTEDRNARAADLGDILSKDPSISSMILKLVNSAYYGSLRHISSINHATVILGFQMVKTIAMGVLIYQSKSSGIFNREKFWVHSIGVATLAKLLAEKLGTDEEMPPDSVFLSGLLHDVGKVIFDNYFTEDYRKVAELAETEQLWIGEAERRILDMDHTEAGFYLARKWQFPAPVVSVIRFHHTLEKCDTKNGKLCAIVHAADYCCRKMHLGSGGDNQEVPLDPLVAEYGISEAILAEVIAEGESRRQALESFVSE